MILKVQKVIHSTEKAILYLSSKGDVWVPRVAIELDNGGNEVTIASWFTPTFVKHYKESKKRTPGKRKKGPSWRKRTSANNLMK
tara:strand:+ start:238 stop:489 length:252 start_codon:yes stop_codon:yes gene_type:complete